MSDNFDDRHRQPSFLKSIKVVLSSYVHNFDNVFIFTVVVHLLVKISGLVFSKVDCMGAAYFKCSKMFSFYLSFHNVWLKLFWSKLWSDWCNGGFILAYAWNLFLMVLPDCPTYTLQAFAVHLVNTACLWCFNFWLVVINCKSPYITRIYLYCFNRENMFFMDYATIICILASYTGF